VKIIANFPRVIRTPAPIAMGRDVSAASARRLNRDRRTARASSLRGRRVLACARVHLRNFIAGRALPGKHHRDKRALRVGPLNPTPDKIGAALRCPRTAVMAAEASPSGRMMGMGMVFVECAPSAWVGRHPQLERRYAARAFLVLGSIVAAANAWSRSPRISSMCSMPTERRT
jgi:hypothetical protein